jgi:hypothetical protein
LLVVRFDDSLLDTFEAIQFSCRRCGKLRSFLSSAIAPDTFLREVPLAVVVSSSAEALQTRIYLVRIPRRKATPFNATCWLASANVCSCHRIYGHIRVGSNGRDLELPVGNSDRTTFAESFSGVSFVMVIVHVRFRRIGDSVSGECSTLGIRFLFGQHMPDNRRQLSHHRHAGNAAASPAFDPLVPFAQLFVFPERLVSHLR